MLMMIPEAEKGILMKNMMMLLMNMYMLHVQTKCNQRLLDCKKENDNDNDVTCYMLRYMLLYMLKV